MEDHPRVRKYSSSARLQAELLDYLSLHDDVIIKAVCLNVLKISTFQPLPRSHTP